MPSRTYRLFLVLSSTAVPNSVSWGSEHVANLNLANLTGSETGANHIALETLDNAAA